MSLPSFARKELKMETNIDYKQIAEELAIKFNILSEELRVANNTIDELTKLLDKSVAINKEYRRCYQSAIDSLSEIAEELAAPQD